MMPQPCARRQDQSVETEIRAAGTADSMLLCIHALDTRLDELRVEVSGDLRQGVPRGRSQTKGFRDGQWAVDEGVFWRDEGQGDAITNQRSQGDQRLEARHAPAHDYNSALVVGHGATGHQPA